MRSIPLLIAGTAAACAVAACTMAPGAEPMGMRTADSQHQLDLMLAGRVPQRPVSCLPSTTLAGNDMRVIDSNTLAFRYGSEVYVAHTTGCTNLSPNGMYALLTRNFGGATGLCHGDVAQVVEPGSGLPVGSCLITDITPFVPAPRQVR